MFLRTSLLFLIILSGCVFPKDRNPGDISESDRLAAQGLMHLRAKQYDQAESAFTLSNEIWENAPAIDGLGCLAFYQKDYEQAEKFFKKAHQVNPKYYNSIGNLALLYEVTNRKDSANELYREALEGDPKNFKIHNNFGGFLFDNYSREEKYSLEAEKELLKAQSLAPEDLLVRDNLNFIQSRRP